MFEGDECKSRAVAVIGILGLDWDADKVVEVFHDRMFMAGGSGSGQVIQAVIRNIWGCKRLLISYHGQIEDTYIITS